MPSEPPPAVVQLQVVGDDRAALDTLVEHLLERRLVACGQLLGPLVSRYRWQGRVERAEEWLVLLKTRAALVDAVRAVVVERHPYDVPELIVLPVVGGNPDYLDWVGQETAEAG